MPESRRHFETDKFTAELSNRDASLTRFELTTYNERAPIWLARALSPRGFRASTYGGSYAEMAARGQSTQ